MPENYNIEVDDEETEESSKGSNLTAELMAEAARRKLPEINMDRYRSEDNENEYRREVLRLLKEINHGIQSLVSKRD